MADFVAYQDVTCVFPMSGQYGRAPRTLYYFLLIFVAVVRKENWLTAGAAATCLTFGGAAAVHSIILTSYLSLGRSPMPDGPVLLPNSSTITVVALATDLDSDATLAVVGTGFLIVVPLALWSSNFKHAAAAPILVLWSLLMSTGMIASMINLYSVDGSSSGQLKQYRFCRPGLNDTLPFSGNSATFVNGSWNDTVWSFFEQDGKLSSECFYPCLSGNQILRPSDALTVIRFFDLLPSDPLYFSMNAIAAIIYGCVPLSILICLVILILQLRGYDLQWDFESAYQTSWRSWLKKFILGAINAYGKILSPFVFLVFLIWIEWIISYDLQAESMEEIGQWAPLVGFALALVAAIVAKYWPEVSRLLNTHRKRTDIGAPDCEELQSLIAMDEDIPPSAWGVVGMTCIQAHTT